ncbi:MAG: LysM peptidoglycan-binding domain-containing protein [Chitinophagaceae bacterium]|nr:LysM peptidoglycan-binding domain-containing protein [Chitinophagaceae bacterium]
MRDVAQQNGIQLEYLASYNQLTKNTVISEGTRLLLQPAKQYAAVTATTKPAEAAPAPAASAVKYHAVQAKEGLYGIAKKYGVTVQQLREWNHLTSDNLSIGQQLIVSK